MLGLATAILLALALWPDQAQTQTIVVASRDLGAGMVLQAADLKQIVVDAEQAPADAIMDPTQLVNQTLAVVRFAGEPVTTRHIGPAVALAADERGIAVEVEADTGLAGLLRPGMQVGLVATLDSHSVDGDLYAKSLLEDLRVLYVPPEFQARPYTPVSGQLTVQNGEPGTAVVSAPAAQPVRSGVVVLAASTKPQEVVYEMPPLEETIEGDGVEIPVVTGDGNPPTATVIPVELIAALGAVEASFTLVLMPDEADAYTTAGFTLDEVVIEGVQP